MSINVHEDGSTLLRLEFYAAKAVHQRGLGAVLRVVFAAWWNRPRIPPDLSPRLRADMGLPPAPRSIFWPEPEDYWPLPVPMWKPGP
ncbi:hypothetical protein [Devosia ginsengisoli]|uniref:Uncharacterized protein n=1 Tax=Devosia ginsengisoli TaxID=400770 RepID=A0A5B8LQ85_9HYPH|nr:hypothetical protein [Devosia ginsengisoli]QDZ09340.1 hypothetical protein FPZ08_00365 [Devosia ginsengisoli]